MNRLAQTGANLLAQTVANGLAQTGANGLAQTGDNAIAQIQAFAWIIAGPCLGIIGIIFIMGSQQMKEFAKKWCWGIVIGLVVVMSVSSLLEILKVNIAF